MGSDISVSQVQALQMHIKMNQGRFELSNRMLALIHIDTNTTSREEQLKRDRWAWLVQIGYLTKTGTRGPKLKQVFLKNYWSHVNIPTIGTNKISRAVRGVVERGQTRLSWLQPGLVSTHRARTGVNINNQGKWWIKRRVATISPTKNHRNMYLTRMLPSNAGEIKKSSLSSCMTF